MDKKYIPLVILFFLVALIVIPTSFVFAQSGGNVPTGGGGGLVNPLQYGSISDFIAALLRIVATIAFPIIVLFMIYAGFLFVSARGNPDKLTEAKRIFLWTLIGALIILGAEAISIAIQRTVKEIQGNVITSSILAERD